MGIWYTFTRKLVCYSQRLINWLRKVKKQSWIDFFFQFSCNVLLKISIEYFVIITYEVNLKLRHKHKLLCSSNYPKICSPFKDTHDPKINANDSIYGSTLAPCHLHFHREVLCRYIWGLFHLIYVRVTRSSICAGSMTYLKDSVLG